MRYLKTFENFASDDMGRFSDTDSDEQEWLTHIKKEEEEGEEESGLRNEFDEEEESGCPACGGEGCPDCKPEEEEEEEENKPGFRRKVWGDEVIEKKKFNFEKKKSDKKEDKKDDKKGDKKETKGLSASQKKLPAGLQKAILAKKKK